MPIPDLESWKKRRENFRHEFFHHLRIDAIFLANECVHICAFSPNAFLRFNIQTPQTKALAPSPLPFKIINLRPVEVPLDIPVEINRPPNLVKVLNEKPRP